ncbi:hypothetical protein NLG97_g4735 [Lecanicillium saksenae]|uniref:Uncharacterized protein n=1 Tax=Lecanicillium saksenae TaxID=468837 RepID=A0ACC1QXL9_9HYPO|nr:hypothetical protein NLG97_g4735 [Lecanicillium saksenae]
MHRQLWEPVPWVLIAGAVGVPLLTLVTLKQFLGAKKHQNSTYRDEDGEATNDSAALCTASIPRAVLNTAAVAGLSVELYRHFALNPDQTTNSTSRWIPTMNWFFLVMQAFIINNDSRFLVRYMHGVRLAFSAAFSLPWAIYKRPIKMGSEPQSNWFELCLLLIIIVASTSIPRRPAVFYGGKAVDRQFSASVIGRLTFAWGPFHQSKSEVPTSLKMEDLPEIGYASRVRVLKDVFEVRGGTGELWQRLMRAFWSVLVQQWLLVFLAACSQFGSRYALFKLLQALEMQPGYNEAAGVWVVGLGFGLLVETFSKSWLTWVTQMRLQIPIEGMLKTLVLEKTARSKLSGENNSANGKNESAPTEKLSLTDLVTNDCMETANACAHTHHFLMIAFKLILDVGYLAQLLGVKSVLVGSAASLLLALLSTRLSQNHREASVKRAKAHSAVSNLISEALENLRHIRLSSMERVWQKRLASVRDEELKKMWHADIAMAALSLVVNLSPVLLASLALSTYAFETGHLSSSVAFLSLNLFNSLHAEFKEVPGRITDARTSWSSYERLQKFFNGPERKISAKSADILELQNADLAWDSSSATGFALREVSLKFPAGNLSIITGSTGSGKSLLVAGLLDEADICAGSLLAPFSSSSEKPAQASAVSSTALVSQPPWIENCTVKENIIFGSKYNESRYGKVLKACALEKDIGVLPKGDDTVAGLNGAFLSGGQKWRVALARAFYSSSKIIILDDVLSAVDAHVAKQICEQALTGDLAKDRTVILVTHTPGVCLSAAKYHVKVMNGTAAGKSLPLGSVTGGDSDTKLEKEKLVPNPEDETSAAELPRLKPGKLAMMSGKRVFSAYIWASGGILPLAIGIFVTLVARAAANSSSWWLTRWTAYDVDKADSSIASKIGIYLLLSFSAVAAVEIRALILQRMSLHASRSLFQKLVGSVLYAPLSWIDSMPLGELIQTVETDMYSLDNRTTETIHNLLGNVIHLVFILSASCVSAPQSNFFSIAIIFTYANVATRQLSVSRQLMRLIDQSLRPILEHVTSVPAGLATIRAFNRTAHYLDEMDDLSDRGGKLGLHLILGQQWLAVRLGSLGVVFVTAMAAALVYQGADAAKTGLVISLALQLQSALRGATGIFNVQDLLTRTIGRIISLASVERESQEGDQPKEAWPERSNIEARNLVVSYDSSLRPALNNVSFSVKPKQRLGIVGRTGAGKTSLTSALLRFISPTEGGIFIDGVNIAKIKLQRLRDVLTLIPQDPFLFSGTLRSNVDPHGMKSDEAILAALCRVHLTSPNTTGEAQSSKFSNLDMEIDAGGKNLSYGQRQLLCLARALLVQCPILILDEATSAVDSNVDAAIQQVIREDFQDSTILVVAHRLLTVADFDNILVMSDGEVAEFGPPKELMARKGRFWDMVQQSGDADHIISAMKQS